MISRAFCNESADSSILRSSSNLFHPSQLLSISSSRMMDTCVWTLKFVSVHHEKAVGGQQVALESQIMNLLSALVNYFATRTVWPKKPLWFNNAKTWLLIWSLGYGHRGNQNYTRWYLLISIYFNFTRSFLFASAGEVHIWSELN